MIAVFTRANRGTCEYRDTEAVGICLPARKEGAVSSSEPPEGTKPANIFISDCEPHNCERINFVVLSPPVCGNLSQQAWETNTVMMYDSLNTLWI